MSIFIKWIGQITANIECKANNFSEDIDILHTMIYFNYLVKVGVADFISSTMTMISNPCPNQSNLTIKNLILNNVLPKF